MHLYAYLQHQAYVNLSIITKSKNSNRICSSSVCEAKGTMTMVTEPRSHKLATIKRITQTYDRTHKEYFYYLNSSSKVINKSREQVYHLITRFEKKKETKSTNIHTTSTKKKLEFS